MSDFLSLSPSVQREVPTSFSSNTGVLTSKQDINHDIQDRFSSHLLSGKTDVAFYNTGSDVST